MSDASFYYQYRTRPRITNPITAVIIHTRTSAFTTMCVRIYMFIIYSDVFVWWCISLYPLLVDDVLFQLC